MRLPLFLTIGGLLAITQFTGTFGVPVNENAILPTRTKNRGLVERAPLISMDIVARNTWQGIKASPSVVTGMRDSDIKEYAIKIYDHLSEITNIVVLVAVIWVPGRRGGFAAGTIWHGLDSDFRDKYLPHAPNTLKYVSNQERVSSRYPSSLWHAEIVAAQKAEVAYGDMMRDNQWPRGTKITVYGKIDKNDKVGYKDLCSYRSSVTRSCAMVISRDLNIAQI